MSGLSIDAVTKQFGDFRAVDDVSLSVPHGTFVCLLGPSGCGKTTLLRMIAGLEEPTSGTIALDGADITDVPTHRRNFGMVFQSLALFPHRSVGENIEFPLKIRGVDAAARRAHALELLELVRLPAHYYEKRIHQCSGGERQRVALARALVTQPACVLADEPTGNLDRDTADAVFELMLGQCRERGMALVVVTHDTALAARCARAVRLVAGRIDGGG